MTDFIDVIFETHSTSVDNEAGLAAGWHDADLSDTGEMEARDLGFRYDHASLAAVFCSDLRRAYRTAEIAFGRDVPIVRDRRLRECDFGALTRHPVAAVRQAAADAVLRPFPGGESYDQATRRVASFLDDLFPRFQGATVLIVGHRATHFALDRFAGGRDLAELVAAEFTWQPGWRYRLSAPE